MERFPFKYQLKTLKNNLSQNYYYTHSIGDERCREATMLIPGVETTRWKKVWGTLLLIMKQRRAPWSHTRFIPQQMGICTPSTLLTCCSPGNAHPPWKLASRAQTPATHSEVRVPLPIWAHPSRSNARVSWPPYTAAGCFILVQTDFKVRIQQWFWNLLNILTIDIGPKVHFHIRNPQFRAQGSGEETQSMAPPWPGSGQAEDVQEPTERYMIRKSPHFGQWTCCQLILL